MIILQENFAKKYDKILRKKSIQKSYAKVNMQAIVEDTVLRLLYLDEDSNGINTDDLHEILNNSLQEVNNIVSNRFNETSYIQKGYIKYDEKEQMLLITNNGIKCIESLCSDDRE